MAEVTEIHKSTGVPVAAMCRELNLPRATLYRKNAGKSQILDVLPPMNALSEDEKKALIDVLHSERFADCTPYQVYHTLLDENAYFGSVSTMYRTLRELGETKDRRAQRKHRDGVKPELIATEPNQVWSWDITKLLCTKRLVYYHLYVIIDIFSRYIVGWMIADRECQDLAKKLIVESVLKYPIKPGQLTIHSDNGPSMTSGTVAQMLDKIGVSKTHNRPYTSNDNPFSESHFKTLKYCPEFPGKFESIEEAEQFCQIFFNFYNNNFYHSGVLFLKPISVHSGKANEILHARHDFLMQKFLEKPIRFNHKMPIIKKLKAVYINPPKNIDIENNLKMILQKEQIMV
jgi:transposase InsO family protein